MADELHTQLNLPMHYTQTGESGFFKHHYLANWRNRGVMIREGTVID